MDTKENFVESANNCLVVFVGGCIFGNAIYEGWLGALSGGLIASCLVTFLKKRNL